MSMIDCPQCHERYNSDIPTCPKCGRSTGSGGDITDAGANLFIMAAIIGPIIAAKVVGFLFGALSHLGIVGRILQSLFMGFAGFILLFFCAVLGLDIPRDIFLGVLIAFVLLPAAWYFLWHYHTVKQMDASTFSEILKKATMFGWFGNLAAIVIGFVKGDPIIKITLVLLATVAGIVYYIIKTRPYAKEAARVGGDKIPIVAKLIVMLAVVGLAVVGTVLGIISVAAQRAQWAAEDALIATPEERAKYNAEDYTGQTVTVYPETYKLYAQPSVKSEVVKTLNRNDTLTVTGKLSGLWVPVSSEGANGWAYALFLMTESSTPRRIIDFDRLFPYTATVTAPIEAEDRDPLNPTQRGNKITLSAGTSVIVTGSGATTSTYAQNTEFAGGNYLRIEHNGDEYGLKVSSDDAPLVEYVEPAPKK
jgi:hypothetical protein